jgi:hypothetical protein
VAVDLPRYQHHHLQSYWQKNVGVETDIEDRCEGGRGSSSSVSSEGEYVCSSLSESIMISRI